MADPVKQFLEQYEPSVQEVALLARELVLRVVPEAEEKLHRPWKTIAYGCRLKFCAISPQKSWVNLQFHSGSSLPDPSHLLQGTGKSMRHVKLRSVEDVRRKPLASLLAAAAKLAR